MKQKILTLFFSLLFIGSLSAQSHMISYKFSLEGCEQGQNFELFRGIMFEGSSFTFEETNLPETEAQLQFFYDLLVGSEFGIPEGSLNEDVELDIVLEGLCNLVDMNNLPDVGGLLNLLSLRIDVVGSESGIHPDDEYYYFQNNSELYVKLKLEKISPFLAYFSYSIDDFTPFYLNSNDSPDYNGIRKVVDDQYCTIYATHFSTINVGINSGVTGVNSSNNVSNNFELQQNYPNPFNPSTTINFNLPTSGLTKLVVYNSLGQEVATLVNENVQAGLHSVDFNASNLPSGMYFYTLTSGNFTQTSKMILMK